MASPIYATPLRDTSQSEHAMLGMITENSAVDYPTVTKGCPSESYVVVPGAPQCAMAWRQTWTTWEWFLGIRHPAPTIPPERRLGLKRLYAGEQVFITLGALERPPPGRAGSASLVFNSRESSPMRVFSRAFLRARRAAFWSRCWTSKALEASARI